MADYPAIRITQNYRIAFNAACAEYITGRAVKIRWSPRYVVFTNMDGKTEPETYYVTREKVGKTAYLTCKERMHELGFKRGEVYRLYPQSNGTVVLKRGEAEAK